MVAAAVALSVAAGTFADGPAPAVQEPFVQPRDANGRFVNLDRREPRGLGSLLRWQWEKLLGHTTRSAPHAPVPRVTPDWQRLQTPPGPGDGVRLTWIGHASWLVQLDGKSLLIDPVLSEALPGFVGRNAPVGIPQEKLPPIDAVLVTHNHYDHMDMDTLQPLRIPVIAGLGVKSFMRRHGLPCTELGWWQSTSVGGVTVTFVPAEHYSQRSVGDRNQTLWGGFVVQGSSATVYHAGDTAFFDGFRQIGERFQIDAALMPIGAYDPAWFMDAVHVSPEQALQAFQDLRATTFFAMHWGTFKLSDEPLDEPPRRLEAERVRRGLPPEVVRVLAIGESAEVKRRAPAEAPATSVPPPESQPPPNGALPAEVPPPAAAAVK
jgi:L-ascorbate metabolism protein UlaG (beta-lactamase superfamily)